MNRSNFVDRLSVDRFVLLFFDGNVSIESIASDALSARCRAMTRLWRRCAARRRGAGSRAFTAPKSERGSGASGPGTPLSVACLSKSSDPKFYFILFLFIISYLYLLCSFTFTARELTSTPHISHLHTNLFDRITSNCSFCNDGDVSSQSFHILSELCH